MSPVGFPPWPWGTVGTIGFACRDVVDVRKSCVAGHVVAQIRDVVAAHRTQHVARAYRALDTGELQSRAWRVSKRKRFWSEAILVVSRRKHVRDAQGQRRFGRVVVV
jgi:hypothetical protein